MAEAESASGHGRSSESHGVGVRHNNKVAQLRHFVSLEESTKRRILLVVA